MRSLFLRLAAGVVVVASATPAHGQIVTQWNFPTGFTLTSPAPSVGAGTASLLGGTTATSASGTASGGSTEPAPANTAAWNVTTFPAQGAASGTAGTRFDVSTTGQSNLVVRLDNRHSNSSSRFVGVEYTLDGTTFTSAGVFAANTGGDEWYNNRTVDLSGVAGANNNALFAVRVVSVFEPGTTAYAGTTPGVAYATTGTVRFDAVTVTAGQVFTGGTGTGLDVAGNFAGGAAPGATGTVLLGAAAGANTTPTTAAGGTTLAQLVFQGGAPAFAVGGADTLALSAGLVNNATAAQSVTAPVAFGIQNSVQNNGTLTFGGTVTAVTSLNLQGAGTTNFNGAVTLASGTAGMRVGSGTLGGTGAIAVPTVVQRAASAGLAAATVRGGTAADPTGVLTFNNNRLTLNGGPGTTGARLGVDLNGATASAATVSRIGLAGTAALNFATNTAGALGPVVVALANDAGLTTGTAYSFTVVDGAAGSGYLLNGTAVTSYTSGTDFTLQAPNFGFTGVTLAVVSDDLVLTFTTAPVPEPATVLLAATAGLGLVRLARRRLSNARGAVAV